MLAVTSLLFFINYLCKLIEIYIYVRKRHPFTSYLVAKHPKHNTLAVTGIQKKPVDNFDDAALA